MSMQAPLVLPFAVEVDEHGHEKSLSREAEMALLFSMIDRKTGTHPAPLLERIMSKILRRPRETVNMTLLLKILYPMWISPLRGEKHLLVDGLGILTHTLSYDEIPDSKAFIKGITGTPSVDQYLSILREHRVTFLSFKGTLFLTAVGLVRGEDLMRDLQSCMALFRREEVVKAISVNPRITWKQANQMTETLLKVTSDSEEDIRALTHAKDALINQSTTLIHQLEETLKATREEATSHIQEAELNSRSIIENLQKDYQSNVTRVEKQALEEIENLKRQQAELAAELSELEHQKIAHLKALSKLKTQLNKPRSESSAITARRDKLFTQLSELEVKLTHARMEQAKFQGLTEARKGDVSESIARGQLERTEKQIKSIETSSLSINDEIQKLNGKLQNLQTILSQLDQQISSLTDSVERLSFSRSEKEDLYASIPYQMEDIRRRTNENLRRMGEEYRQAVRREKLRIKELEGRAAEKVESQQRTIDELTKRTEEITLHIESLIERKSGFVDEFGKRTISLPKESEVKETTLLQIPFYLVRYETPSGTSDLLFPPLAIKLPRRRIMGWKQPSAVPMKTSFDQILKVKLSEAIKYDGTLFQEIEANSSVVNLLKDPTTIGTLLEGLSQLGILNSRAHRFKAQFLSYFHRGERQ